MLNNKGNTQITVVFVVLMFLILWPLFFATQLTYWGQTAIINGGLAGFEAFFFANLNAVIAFVLILFILGWVYLARE